MIFRRKWLLASLFGAITILTIALVWLLPNQYVSRMRILVLEKELEITATRKADKQVSRGRGTGVSPVRRDISSSVLEQHSHRQDADATFYHAELLRN